MLDNFQISMVMWAWNTILNPNLFVVWACYTILNPNLLILKNWFPYYLDQKMMVMVYQSEEPTTISLVMFKYIVVVLPLKQWLCIKPGTQEWRTECEERGKWREYYISRNVAKHFRECHQTFRDVFSNILGNVLKHSGVMSPMFGVNKERLFGQSCI